MSKNARFLLIVLLLLLLTTSTISAQDDAESDLPPLRELAAERDFYIGAAIQSGYLNESDYNAVLAREFNMIATEWETKMEVTHPAPGVFDFNRTDAMVNFAEENDMLIRGHTLLWHQQFPDWLLPVDYTREQAIDLMRDYIYTVVGRYQGRILYWDVVNEAITEQGSLRNTPWLRMIGDDYLDFAFQFAHEADPDAILYYNDYNAEATNEKSDGIYAMIADMIERGIPVHGVGFQTHLVSGMTGKGRNIDPADMIANLQRFADLGLEVQITELDVRVSLPENEISAGRLLERQARDYRNIFEICLSVEACTGVVIWGFTDKYTFHSTEVENAAPLLFDAEYGPKEAYFAVAETLAAFDPSGE